MDHGSDRGAGYREVPPGAARPARGEDEVRPGREATVHVEAPDRLERLDEEARCDGIFPLVSNDRSMTECDLLLAYKQQPAIERRFEHLKTDFVVAPMYLKEVSRIQA